LTDIHTEAQAEIAATVVDVLQIPALLCRQTDLITAAARTGKIVNLKKGQFLSPREMEHAAAKANFPGPGKCCSRNAERALGITIWSRTCARFRSCGRLASR